MDEVFEEAEQQGADFLLFHHPLLFHPSKSVDTGSYPGTWWRAAAKTSPRGSHELRRRPGRRLGRPGRGARAARHLEVLSPRGSLRKLVIFVPEDNVDAVADALASEGAGVIGEYTRCTFRTPGTGTFLGGEATDPTWGRRAGWRRLRRSG